MSKLNNKLQSISFQIASCLQLELRSNFSFPDLIKPVAPILCLAGDIASPYSKITNEFVKWASNQWEHVLWVPGYHELAPIKNGFMTTMNDAHIKLLDVCHHYPNVHIMLNKSFKIKDTPYLFLGSPLWGYNHTYNIRFRSDGPHHSTQAIVPFQLNAMTEANFRWFDGHIEEAKELNEKVICMSYSPPVSEFRLDRDANRTNWMMNNMPKLIRYPVYTWIVGDLYESIRYCTPSKIDTHHKCALLSNSLKDIVNNNYKNDLIIRASYQLK